MNLDKEQLKAKLIRFAEAEAEISGKTPQEVLQTIIKGQRMRIPSKN